MVRGKKERQGKREIAELGIEEKEKKKRQENNWGGGMVVRWQTHGPAGSSQTSTSLMSCSFGVP